MTKSPICIIFKNKDAQKVADAAKEVTILTNQRSQV